MFDRKLALASMIAFVLIGFLSQPEAHSESNVKVGLFYYVWYETYHWDQTVLDTPLLGHYNSSDLHLIQTHFWWFEDLGIDFLIISYWGWFESEPTTYNSTQTLFNTAESFNTTIKLCIIVEPTHENETADNFNFTWIHDDIYNKYATRQCYLRWQEKPLLLYYNADNMTKNGHVPKDNRFTQFIVGHHLEYVDWIYSAPVCGVTQQVRNRQISVMPSYDDSHFRPNNQTYDVYYEEGMYNAQWEKALDEAKAGNVGVVTIATWNEWHERTAIEPHYRNGTGVSPFYAYGLTKNYIRELHECSSIDVIISMLTYMRNLMYVLIATTSILVVATVYIIKRKPKR